MLHTALASRRIVVSKYTYIEAAVLHAAYLKAMTHHDLHVYMAICCTCPKSFDDPDSLDLDPFGPPVETLQEGTPPETINM